MSFVDYVHRNLPHLTFLTLQHVEAVLVSVAAATVIGVGLAVATEHAPRARAAALALSGTVLTIPSFALFGLMIPLIGLGVVPTVLALTVYAVFPILRNTITGLDGVDAGTVDAARGMGMSSRRRLLLVRFPLGWPVVLNGIRLATIMLVAIAAIGAAVRGPGLGQPIFTGLARIGGANALNQALAGVLGIVLVAVVLDVVFLLLSRLTTPRGLRA